MRTDSREGEEGLTPFILLHRTLLLTAHSSSLRGVRRNFRGCAAKALYAAQLPLRSSSRVGSVRRDEREGEERARKSLALFQTIPNNTSYHSFNKSNAIKKQTSEENHFQTKRISF